MGRTLLSGVVASLLATGAAATSPALMPLPRTVALTEGTLAWPGRFATSWTGCGPAAPLDRALQRLERDLEAQSGVAPVADSTPLQVSCRQPGGTLDQREDYRLTVESGRVRIEAETPAGVLRAFATLRQLAGLSVAGVSLPLGRIEDAPRFAWRGILLDPARHFISVATLKRQIDAMERVKLNVLHLHLSDDQGFRVESRRFPKLTPPSGQWYTQAEIRDLVAYAAERGVRVVPEFDVPGHTRAIVDAYPDVGISKPGFAGLRDTALNPGNEATYRFLDSLFGEMAGLFPDPYFHLGGDEVARDIWKGVPAVSALMAREKLTDSRAVQGYFVRRVHDMLHKRGKVAIGWDEVAAAGAPGDLVVQAWRSSNATAAATAAGHKTIVSAGYYLDLFMPADFHYAIDPLSTSAAGLSPADAAQLRAMSPLLAAIVTDAIVAGPLPPLGPEQEKLVLGGEAALWGELTTDELVDHHLWPRAAALAERFWSPAAVRDPADMYRRLAIVSDQLTATGLADRGNRARMALRLAPGDSDAVETLLSITGPVRNMAHDHRIKAMLAGKTIAQPLNDLADAAPVDSLTARRFAADAAEVARGNRSHIPALRAQLEQWRANDARFRAAVAGRRNLEAALPASARIAALARAGIEALDAIEAGRRLDAATAARARALVEESEALEAATAKPLFSFLAPPAPADLLVKIGPGIRTLVDAASH